MKNFMRVRDKVSRYIFQSIKEDLLTTPFQNVADRYALERHLKDDGMGICLEMEYNGLMNTFDDYPAAMDNSALKFLVTAGYSNLQKSKIRQLGIENDFNE